MHHLPHLVTALAFSGTVWASGAARAEDRLNVVMLDICSTRADHFGSYGYARDTTPSMDRYARRSVLFENALSEGSWCLPSYASLLTGHVPEVHGQYTSLPAGKLPGFETTLAQVLKRSGYRTALFSGGVYLTKGWGLAEGFDEYVNNFRAEPPRVPAPFEANLDGVLAWIAKNKAAPFFVFATVDDMHVPYHSHDPERYDPGYQGIVHDSDVLTVNFARAYNGEAHGYDPALLRKVAEFKSDPRHLRHLIAHYDAALHEVDGKVDEFLEKLRAMGLEGNTVVIISADHGEMLGEKGLINHTQGLYEPVLRVPLIVHHPRYESLAGTRMKQPVQRIDLMPTILEIAKAPTQGLELQGMSLVRLLDDPNASWREYAFARSKRNLARLLDLQIEERVVRAGCWKLHHYIYKDGYELYDVCADRLETRNVVGERPDVAARLSFELVKDLERSRPHAPGLPSGGLGERVRALSQTAPGPAQGTVPPMIARPHPATAGRTP